MRLQLFLLGMVGALVGVSAPGARITAHVDEQGRRVYVNAEAPADQTASKPKAGARHSLLVRRDSFTNQLVAVPARSEPAPSREPTGAEEASHNGQPDTGTVDSLVQPSLIAPEALDEIIVSTADRHAVDAHLVRAIIKVESNFNPTAISHKGAIGLMQLMPTTARRFGVGNVFDPEENLDGGVRYLKHLLGLYGGNLTLSLAAYNAGEQAVQRHGGIPPYSETRQYVRKVSNFYGRGYALRPQPRRPVIMKWLDERGRVHFSNTEGW